MATEVINSKLWAYVLKSWKTREREEERDNTDWINGKSQPGLWSGQQAEQDHRSAGASLVGGIGFLLFYQMAKYSNYTNTETEKKWLQSFLLN